VHAGSPNGAQPAVWMFLALLALSVVGRPVEPSDNRPESPTSPPAAKRQPPGVLILEEPPQRLPRHDPATETERNRREALALFSTARSLEHQKDYAAALRFYQRALRCDPEAASVAEAIVRLAFGLGRHGQAARYYALNADLLEDIDPKVLSGLGFYLAQQGDWQQALALYEKALAARKQSESTVTDIILRMEMGRLYWLSDEYEKAADCFAQVLKAFERPDEFEFDADVKEALLGKRHATYNLIGESFLLADRPEEAIAAFKKSHEIAPNEGLLKYNLARVDLLVGKPNEALAKLQVYFDEHLASQAAAPYRLLADILKELDKDAELIGRLEKLRADDASNVPLGYFLAGKYAEAKLFDKAETLYLELAEKSPTVTGYRGLVDIYRNANRHDALLDVLGRAAADNAILELFGEGQAISDDPKLVRTLVKTAEKRRQDKPDDFNHGLQLATGLLALESGQYDTAGEFFDLALQSKPDRAAEILLLWGLSLLDDEQYKPAAEVFKRGIDEKTPSDKTPIFYYYLAFALEMAGQTDDALAAARKAIELKGDSAPFRSRAAWILYHSGRHDEAVKAYTELIDRFDAEYGSTRLRRLLRESRLVLSNLCVLQGKLAQAEEWLEQVLDEFPEDVSALNDLGYLWADANKNIERAYRMIEQAVRQEPDNAAYRDSLGWVLFRQGRLEEAVLELEKAAASEADPVILDHLGDAYQSIHKPEKARDAWRRAVEAFQNAEQPEKAKKVQQKIDPSQ